VAFKKWKVFLQGMERPFMIKMDCKNLIGFLTIKDLN